jgi:thioredoxin 1
MKTQSSKWTTIAIVGLVLLIAAALSGRLPTTCPFRPGSSIDPSGGARGSDVLAHASEATFEDMVLRSETPVLVDFYADWCVPCQTQGPLLEDYARKNPDAKIVKVNVDENPRLAAVYQIDTIPRLMTFRDGEVVATHRGVAGKDQIEQLLTQ